MTFDNLDELKKIHQHYPDAELVLRILPDDSHSLCKLGTKFGAHLDVVPDLLRAAKRFDLNVIGISFHVGSGCYDACAFVDALMIAKAAFKEGEKQGFRFSLLDIGGGFPGTDDSSPTFAEITSLLNPLFDEFPPEVRIIAEPGRFFAASTLTLATNVHSRREFKEEEQRKFLYYIDDGVYGSFNCTIFDHQYPQPHLLHVPSSPDLFKSNIFGPTCDSLDLVAKEALLPELEVGDWIIFENMGAYTTAAASNFNGFQTSRVFFVLTGRSWS